MNDREARLAKNFASVTRAGRKVKGLGQTELASSLGISQSLLSKIEKAYIVPSAPIWFGICDILSIPAHAGVLGYIDTKKDAVLTTANHYGSFKIPKRYSFSMGSMSRTSRPMLNFLTSTLGPEKKKEFLKDKSIDEDFFTVLDHPININFNLDLAMTLITAGKLRPKSLSVLGKNMSASYLHGALETDYRSAKDATELMRILSKNMTKYDANWKYTFDFGKKNLVTIHSEPREHLREFKYYEDVLGNFINEYKRVLFKQLLTDYGFQAQVTGIQESKNLSEPSIYQIQINS